MKSMTKNQRLCLIFMIAFMILADVLMCIDNSTAHLFSYISILIVMFIGIYVWILGSKHRKDKEIQDARKIIEESIKKKKVNK